MVISGGIFKSGIRYTGVALGVELIAQTQAQRADLTLHRTAEYRNVLKRAVQRLLSLSEERIRHGESNVKNHTFLSMVLAEVESVEQGTSTEPAIAQSARDSLQFCHGLLLARQGSVFVTGLEDVDSINLESDVGELALEFDLDSFLQDSIFS